MRKQAISIALVVSGLIVLTGVFTDWRIASGYVFGAMISALLYWRTTMFCDQVLDLIDLCLSVVAGAGGIIFGYHTLLF